MIEVVATVVDTPAALTLELGEGSSEVGSQSVHPLLGLFSVGIGSHQQEFMPVSAHVRAGCFRSSV